MVTGQNFVVEGNEVVQYEQIRPKTEDEIENEGAILWQNIRNERNRLLTESDWTQVSDSPLTLEQKTEWQTYRQELRDITNQSNPHNILWPTKPQ